MAEAEFLEDFEQLAGLATIVDWRRWAITALQRGEVFFGHGTDNAVTEADVLLSSALHLDIEQLQEFQHARLTAAEQQRVYQWLKRRVVERVPAAYITGQAWFAGLPFIVDERVLVPRSPIAELIDQRFAPWLQKAPERILDLCTGSGCIAIALAYAFPDAEVDGLDLSQDALAVAEQNIAMHGLEQRVFPMQSDLYSAVAGQRYDFIVTNPPYVDADDMATLPAEFEHEPELGLAAGEDGLDLVRTILKEAPEHLHDDGFLVCEVGNSMVAMMEQWPEVPFHWVEFAFGGDGVFVLSKAQLIQFHEQF